MILSILLLIGSAVLNILALPFWAVTELFRIVIPEQVPNAFLWLFGNLNYFNGIFPITALVSATLMVLSVWFAKYAVRIVLWLLAFIPGFKHNPLPDELHHVTDLRRPDRHRIDLRKRSFGGKKFWDIKR